MICQWCRNPVEPVDKPHVLCKRNKGCGKATLEGAPCGYDITHSDDFCVPCNWSVWHYDDDGQLAHYYEITPVRKVNCGDTRKTGS